MFADIYKSIANGLWRKDIFIVVKFSV